VVVEAGRVLPGCVVVVRFVYVIPEVEDEVEVGLLGDRGVRVVEAGLVALAGDERDAEARVGVAGRGGPEAADRRALVLGVEAVEVLLRRLQAANPGAGREVAVLPGGDGLLEDDVLEVAVPRGP